ncbi:ribonuclease P protein subunit p21 [Calliphora vicina]|uniref:ribonuclease P protein subunit p21 n=1 Tax=Calliphora vicina TaxID=7373 RepID=UPI00325A8885
MSQSKSKHYFQGKECFSRMNFLYQASLLMAGKNNTLSSYYGELCKNVGKKSVLRIDPTVKRDFCKRCSLAQKPGLTSELSVKSMRKKKRKHKSIEHLDKDAQMQLACKLCGYQRNFNVNEEYKFWLENPESVAEVYIIKTEEKQSNKTNNSNDKTDKTRDKD